MVLSPSGQSCLVKDIVDVGPSAGRVVITKICDAAGHNGASKQNYKFRPITLIKLPASGLSAP